MMNDTDSHAQSFNDRITQTVENIVRPLRGALEKEIASVVDELATAIAAERTAALEQERDAAIAGKETAVRDAVAAVRSEHETVLNEARQAATIERDAAVREAHATAEAATITAVADAVSRAQAEADAAMTVQRDEAYTRLETVKAESEASLAAVKSEAERTLNARLAEDEARAAAALETSLTAALVSERQADMAWVERLLDTMRTIDQARSMSDVLDALANHALVESGRVAVFLVRDGRLRGWRFGGFAGLPGEPREIELSLDESGIIARAVTGHDCAATSDRGLPPGETGALPPGSLLHLPQGRAGFAAPVCVAGQVVAVVYADEGDVEAPPVPSPWPEIVEITARHASRCLELLMAARMAAWTRPSPTESAAGVGTPGTEPAGQEATPQSHAGEDEDAARRYARLLISEIKLYHESDVNQGKRERDLLQRLRPEIDRARRLFEERVPPDVRSRADCFEQELVRTLADGNASLLGQAT